MKNEGMAEAIAGKIVNYRGGNLLRLLKRC